MLPRTVSPRPVRQPAAADSMARLNTIGLVLLVLWTLALILGPVLLVALDFSPDGSGHVPLYAHGHPFADARAFWGLSNAMDVLSNLPLAAVGLSGCLLLLSDRRMPAATWTALQVFFMGLLLVALGSAWYHWAPSAAGLALGRLGMAVVFGGAVSLAVAERVGQRSASVTLTMVLMTALLSAVLPLTHGNVLPWVVVQFGGLGVIAWASLRPQVRGAMGVRLGWLVALYAVAKVAEATDAAVFQLTGEWISGHSLKHVVAALAAWPVLSAVKQWPLQQQGPALKPLGRKKSPRW